MEREHIEKRSATTGTVQNGTLRYEDHQHLTATVGTPAWYAWLETATAFRFVGAEGTFTAHKVRAGNRRGSWYWRAYRRRHGRLSRCYLGISANLTLPCLQQAARCLAARSEETGIGKETRAQGSDAQTMTAPTVRTPIAMLSTKVALPRLSGQHVARPQLLARMREGVQRPLTLVSAPAGSGKTTLLAEWAATTTSPVAWLSCEVADNDPARFLSYLMAALARLDARIDSAGWMDQHWYTRDLEQALIGPLNELVRLQQDAVVILDDYYLITTDAVHALLRFLLDHLPARLHLLIGTRVDPPLPLARLRARNQLSEVRVEDLRFDAAEVAAFAHTMGLTLTDEAMGLLHARTEGWIAGIQLLALALRRHTDAAAFLQASGDTHRYLLDYVCEEVLAQQPAEMQRFLLRTSLLEPLTGPLCEAVTGEPGGQQRLAAALQANLFLSALDDTQTWYRYHPLFAQVLRTRLQQLEPELVPEIYRRASHWYEQQQQQQEACAYALQASDQLRAANLLAYLIPQLLEQGKFLQMRQLLSQISPALVAESPTLWLVSISMPMLSSGIQSISPRAMASIVEHIEQQIQAHAEDGESAWAELRAGLPIMQAIAALAQGDPARAIFLANEIPPVLARSESALSRFIALGRRGLLAVAYGANGDLAATEHFYFAGSPSVSGGDDHTRNLAVTASLSDLYEAHGQLRTLGRFYGDLFQNPGRGSISSSPLLSTLLQARYALLLYEWNRLNEAEQAVQQSENLAGRLGAAGPLVPLITLLNRWTQARIALARGERSAAGPLLECVEPDPTMLYTAERGQRFLAALRARLALTCDHIAPAWRWIETSGIHYDDTLPLQLTVSGYLDYITLARVLLALGRSRRDSMRLSQTVVLLTHLRELAEERGWPGRLREIELLMALTLQAQGKTKRALATLGAALAQAEPEGYVRVFADEGLPMAHLLAQIAAYTTASLGYIQHLQAALAPDPHASIDPTRPASRQPLPHPLSPREQEVLQLVARGYSNQQIADQLVISLHTAKRHVKHLLAKLVVTNRTQALARAGDLQLL